MTRTHLVNFSCDNIKFARILGLPLIDNEHITNEMVRYCENCKDIDILDEDLYSFIEQLMMGDEDIQSRLREYPDLIDYDNETKRIYREIYCLKCFKFSSFYKSFSIKLVTDERIMMLNEDLKSRLIYMKPYVKHFGNLLDYLAELDYKFRICRRQFNFLLDENHIILLKLTELSM
jgi:hypothetical protein